MLLRRTIRRYSYQHVRLGLDELLAACYDDVPRDMWKFAGYTLKAHLVRLGVADFDE